MNFVANYEIKADCSLIDDDLVLRCAHAKGSYRVRLQNIPRTQFTSPFLISLHLYFDAPSFEEASDIADELLADCLNMLAFITGGAFRRHRIKQLVDVTSAAPGMRDVHMWSDTIEYDDPQPCIDESTQKTLEKLWEFDVPPAIQRAMRWYRLGINASVPDDQFIYFWFALEIVAEFQKSPDKVPSKCPKCQSPLYCEDCKTQPLHKPYAKQAIKALLQTVDKACDDEMFSQLDTARNSLMHGKTLKEIESKLPDPHEQIVDVLGRLLWRALIFQFPREYFDGSLSIGYPSTYIHRKLNTIAHLQTIVPTMPDGDFDLSFKGLTAQMVPSGPPQSALPVVIEVSDSQYQRLRKISFQKNDHQEMLKRCSEQVGKLDGKMYVQILATDMAIIKQVIAQGEQGEWQDLFRTLLHEKVGPVTQQE